MQKTNILILKDFQFWILLEIKWDIHGKILLKEWRGEDHQKTDTQHQSCQQSVPDRMRIRTLIAAKTITGLLGSHQFFERFLWTGAEKTICPIASNVPRYKKCREDAQTIPDTRYIWTLFFPAKHRDLHKSDWTAIYRARESVLSDLPFTEDFPPLGSSD